MNAPTSTSKPLLGAGLLTALAASLCCITPLLALVGGLGASAAAFSWLEPFRPYLMALTVGVLGFAWYQKLKPAPATDDCGCAADAKPAFTQSRLFLGMVTGLAVLLLAFPYYGARLYPASPTAAPVPAASPSWPRRWCCRSRARSPGRHLRAARCGRCPRWRSSARRPRHR